ncbi:MAG: hypothetical protein U0745_05155 [Polyangia bacterium]
MPRPPWCCPVAPPIPPSSRKLKDALTSFKGLVHPDLQTFHPVTDGPYQKLRDRMQQKSRRQPKLLELTDEPTQLPMPRLAQPTPLQVPLKAFAPVD